VLSCYLGKYHLLLSMNLLIFSFQFLNLLLYLRIFLLKSVLLFLCLLLLLFNLANLLGSLILDFFRLQLKLVLCSSSNFGELFLFVLHLILCALCLILSLLLFLLQFVSQLVYLFNFILLNFQVALEFLSNSTYPLQLILYFKPIHQLFPHYLLLSIHVFDLLPDLLFPLGCFLFLGVDLSLDFFNLALCGFVLDNFLLACNFIS